MRGSLCRVLVTRKSLGALAGLLVLGLVGACGGEDRLGIDPVARAWADDLARASQDAETAARQRRDPRQGLKSASVRLASLPDGFTEPFSQPPTADMIVLYKTDRRMVLYRDGEPWREYQVALGFQPRGHKRYEGDGRTPEGLYEISYKNPGSRFHLSLKVSYPNAEDRRRARSRGVSPGGDIFIHGLPNRGLVRDEVEMVHPYEDWTDGCIALTNEEIEEVWASVPLGTPIDIRP